MLSLQDKVAVRYPLPLARELSQIAGPITHLGTPGQAPARTPGKSPWNPDIDAILTGKDRGGKPSLIDLSSRRPSASEKASRSRPSSKPSRTGEGDIRPTVSGYLEGRPKFSTALPSPLNTVVWLDNLSSRSTTLASAVTTPCLTG